MFFLVLAVCSNCAETIAVRFSEKNLHNRYAVTMFNYIVAVIMCYFFMGGMPAFATAAGDTFPLFLGIFNGVVFISWLFLFQISIRHNGAPMSATFTKLGILLPTFGSIVFFSETPSVLQVVGIIAALAAILLFNLPQRVTEAVPAKPNYKFLLILVLLIGGMGDFNSKIFESFGQASLNGLFLFYTFLVALLLSILIWLKKDRTANKRDLLFGILIGIPNQLTTMFLLWAIMKLPAYIVFPVYSVAVILLVSLLNSILFKERLSAMQRFSMALVCFALVCLNI